MKTNTQKITPEFCAGNILVFRPKTVEEAALIQGKILGLGFGWAEINRDAIIMHTRSCVENGMTLHKGLLYDYVTSDAAAYGVLCAADQFDDSRQPPDRDFIMAQFNKIAARMEELAKDIADIKNQLQPQKLDKPLPKNQNDPAP